MRSGIYKLFTFFAGKRQKVTRTEHLQAARRGRLRIFICKHFPNLGKVRT
ncbi:unnamed protein product, partial [Callosobruchus maculatus]